MKVLVLRFSSIGDIVLTSPVLRCLKKQRPDIQVHYATKKSFQSILAQNPYLDKIHLLDKGTPELLKELRAEKFDLIIDLHKNVRTARIKSALRVKSLSFDKLNREKWLVVWFKINLLPYRHIVDRYLDTLSELGIENDHAGLDFFIDPSVCISQHKLPEDFVVYAIGAQHNTKKLPLNKQLELIDQMKSNLVLIGGPSEVEEGKKLEEARPNIINLCGKLSLHESARVIERSRKIVSHDTGMMHIAAALKKPVISIWGNTIPAFGMYPYYPANFDTTQSNILEVEDLPCRPCSKIGYDKCPRGHFKCMNEQDFSTLEL